MKTILSIVLATCILCGCRDTRLDAALADLELLQRSNDKLSQDLELERQRVRTGESQLASICAEMDSSLAQISPTAHTVTSIPVPIAGVSLAIHEIDVSNGWVYLKYEVGEETRYSDRLWFAGKKDRNSLLVDGVTLLSVDACTERGCTLTSRDLSEIKDVCKQP